MSRQDSPSSPEGDIKGLAGWTLELKNVAHMELGSRWPQVVASAARAGNRRFAMIFKRYRHKTEDAWVVMPAKVFRSLFEWEETTDECSDRPGSSVVPGNADEGTVSGERGDAS